jgi:hypothetical protein
MLEDTAEVPTGLRAKYKRYMQNLPETVAKIRALDERWADGTGPVLSSTPSGPETAKDLDALDTLMQMVEAQRADPDAQRDDFGGEEFGDDDQPSTDRGHRSGALDALDHPTLFGEPYADD